MNTSATCYVHAYNSSSVLFSLPWYMRKCSFRIPFSLKDFFHTPHENGCFTLHVDSSSFRLPLSLKGFLHIICIQTLITVYTFMSREITFCSKTLFTYVARIRALTTMYAFMSHQITITSEWLTTGITGMWTFHTTMFIHSALKTKEKININPSLFLDPQ